MVDGDSEVEFLQGWWSPEPSLCYNHLHSPAPAQDAGPEFGVPDAAAPRSDDSAAWQEMLTALGLNSAQERSSSDPYPI